MMRISGGLLADQTTLTPNEAEVILASSPRRLFREGKADLCSGRAAGGTLNVTLSDRYHRLLVCYIEIGKGGFLEPLLVGSLEHAGVRLQKSVLEREADLGPDEQVLAAFPLGKLAQEAIQ
ncbi:hypothetical protein ABIB80_007500 [Bradyrhizobium sp. i1.15.2]|uniref:hypothetical protein n=1 Tax=Bradyrhizobium sp. i1.15.2 TaxID=3156362 RepID=UPI003393E2F5